VKGIKNTFARSPERSRARGWGQQAKNSLPFTFRFAVRFRAFFSVFCQIPDRLIIPQLA
jgi:hypothetical protein